MSSQSSSMSKYSECGQAQGGRKAVQERDNLKTEDENHELSKYQELILEYTHCLCIRDIDSDDDECEIRESHKGWLTAEHSSAEKYLIAAGGYLLSSFMALAYSTGLFIPYFESELGLSTQNAAILGFCQFGAMTFGSMFAGVLVPMAGLRWTSCLGGLMMTLGFGLCVVCDDFASLFICFDLLPGIGSSLCLAALLGWQHEWFSEKSSLMMTLAFCAIAVFTSLFAIVIEKLLSHYQSFQGPCEVLAVYCGVVTLVTLPIMRRKGPAALAFRRRHSKLRLQRSRTLRRLTLTDHPVFRMEGEPSTEADSEEANDNDIDSDALTCERRRGRVCASRTSERAEMSNDTTSLRAHADSGTHRPHTESALDAVIVSESGVPVASCGDAYAAGVGPSCRSLGKDGGGGSGDFQGSRSTNDNDDSSSTGPFHHVGINDDDDDDDDDDEDDEEEDNDNDIDNGGAGAGIQDTKISQSTEREHRTVYTRSTDRSNTNTTNLTAGNTVNVSVDVSVNYCNNDDESEIDRNNDSDNASHSSGYNTDHSSIGMSTMYDSHKHGEEMHGFVNERVVSPAKIAVAASQVPRTPSLVNVALLRKNPKLIPHLLRIGFFGFVYYAPYTLIVLYFIELDLDQSKASQLLSLVGLASLAGRFSCAYIVERIGSVQVVRLGLYGSLVGLTFFLYDACMHDYYPNQHGSAFYLLLMYVLIGGFAHGTQIPSETILVGELEEDKDAGLALLYGIGWQPSSWLGSLTITTFYSYFGNYTLTLVGVYMFGILAIISHEVLVRMMNAEARAAAAVAEEGGEEEGEEEGEKEGVGRQGKEEEEEGKREEAEEERREEEEEEEDEGAGAV